MIFMDDFILLFPDLRVEHESDLWIESGSMLIFLGLPGLDWTFRTVSSLIYYYFFYV